jgi:hypothetical protein
LLIRTLGGLLLNPLDDVEANQKQAELQIRLHAIEESLDRSGKTLNEKNERIKRLSEQTIQLKSIKLYSLLSYNTMPRICNTGQIARI